LAGHRRYCLDVLIEIGEPLSVAASDSAVVRFGEQAKPEGAWAGRRLMWLGQDAAFELSFWCGTCQLLFKRLEGANETLSLPDVEQRLAGGLDRIDDVVVGQFAGLLSEDVYIPMLLEVRPELVTPGHSGDYFSEEQVATWGLSSFWGLPEYPQTSYYRTWQTAVDSSAHMFEFVVPMVPPTWNDRASVERSAARLATSSAPTAVAVTILDVCQPAMDNGTDYFEHWGLTHFLLDGHHKMEAAAATGRPLRLLSLLATTASLATESQIRRVSNLRAQQHVVRPPSQ